MPISVAMKKEPFLSTFGGNLTGAFALEDAVAKNTRIVFVGLYKAVENELEKMAILHHFAEEDTFETYEQALESILNWNMETAIKV